MSRRVAVAIGAFASLAAGILAVAALVTGQVETPEPYVVQKGDTLFVIARDHGVTVDDLRRWNGIDGDLIEVGQVLWTWGPSNTPESARHARQRPVAVGALAGLDRGSSKRA